MSVVIDLKVICDGLSDDLKDRVKYEDDFDGWTGDVMDVVEQETNFETLLTAYIKKHHVKLIPVASLQKLLVQLTERSIKLKDPTLHRIVFDLGLYDFDPDSDEYSEVMEDIYAKARKQRESETPERIR